MYSETVPGLPQSPQAVHYVDLMARMDQNFLNLAMAGALLLLIYSAYNIFLRHSPRLQDYKGHINGGFDFMALTIGLFWAVVGFMYYI